MARAYSADLRERVLRAHDAGEGSQRVLAVRFGISVGVVCSWLRAARDEGRRGPQPHRGGRRALNGADPQVLAALVAEQSDATLAQYGIRLAQRTGVQASAAALCRALARLGLRRKRRTLHASEQERADVITARDAWRAQVCAGVDPARLAFIDESGVDTAMTPAYARAPRGQRALGRVPGGHWKRLTILGALAADGLIAAMTVAAATTTQVFLAFVERVLLPALRQRPGCLVVMDNLTPHKAACVRTTSDAAGVAYCYLPPYSPDLNPIEPAWSKLKGALRRAKARSLDQLDAELPQALRAITPANAQGWFRHAGYRSN